MTKEEAWLMWMKESKNYVEYDWDTIKKSSWWDAFSRGWDAASVNVNGWDDAYKMGVEAGKEKHWVGLTDEESIELLQKAAKHKSPNYCTAPEMAVEFGRLTSEALRKKNNV